MYVHLSNFKLNKKIKMGLVSFRDYFQPGVVAHTSALWEAEAEDQKCEPSLCDLVRPCLNGGGMVRNVAQWVQSSASPEKETNQSINLSIQESYGLIPPILL